MCNFQLTRQSLHRPHAFRPHLVAFRRAAKPRRIAKLSPESSPCPAACRKKADVNFHSQIAGQSGPPMQHTMGFKACWTRRSTCFQGHAKAASSALPPTCRQESQHPFSLAICRSDWPSRSETLAFLSILEGCQATPRTAPVPPRRPLGLPQRRLPGPLALPRRQLSAGLVRRRTNLQLID